MRRSGRGTRTAVPDAPEIVAPLTSAGRQRARGRGTFRQLTFSCGQIVEHPMNPCPAWRIRVVHDERETLCALRRRAPVERGRDIGAVARELDGDIGSRLDGRCLQSHGRSPSYVAARGLRARMNALANFPSIRGATASTSRPALARNSRALATVYTRHGSISTSSNPAASIVARYADSSRAPATQPIHNSTLRRMSTGTAPRTTTSDTATRPPGFRTRKASRRTWSLSAERLITQFEV